MLKNMDKIPLPPVMPYEMKLFLWVVLLFLTFLSAAAVWLFYRWVTNQDNLNKMTQDFINKHNSEIISLHTKLSSTVSDTAKHVYEMRTINNEFQVKTKAELHLLSVQSSSSKESLTEIANQVKILKEDLKKALSDAKELGATNEKIVQILKKHQQAIEEIREKLGKIKLV
jgi:chromosome segregation ATPase